MPHRRRYGKVITTLLALLVLLGGAAYGGYWWWNTRGGGTDDSGIILHTVARDDFLLAVTERGEIESADVIEVRSEVKTMNQPGLAIIDIVPEGTEVNKGDFLVQLDSSAFEEERIAQQMAVNSALALVTETRSLYETSVIAKQEYLDGTFVQEEQTLEGAVFVAEENLNRAQEYYEYSQKLAAKGYVNKLQLEADKFAVEKSKKELDAARTSLKVLREYTKAKMLVQLESDIKTNKAKWEAEKNSYELAASKLKEIEDRIAKCTITAPGDGVVVYAHETDRRGDADFIVEEGAVIRERQTIIRLPSAESLRVEVNINESLISYVKPGMPATITPVGYDRVMRGTVERVNRYAEPSGWRKANVKEYKAFVKINEAAPEVRSGMTAAVVIRCDFVPDALQVPVQAVYAHGDKYYCFVYESGRLEARPIVCGATNDRYFVVHDGLQESDRVAMNPRKYLDRVELPEIPRPQRQRVVDLGPTDELKQTTPDSDHSTSIEAGSDKAASVAENVTSATAEKRASVGG